jgi:hypothetical protein
VLIEAAIGLGMLLYLVLVGCDLIRLNSQLNAVQWAVSKAARWSSYADLSSEDGHSKAQVVKDYVGRIAQGAGVSLDSDQIQVCSARAPGCNPESLLDAGELYVLRVRKELSLISLLGVSFTHEVEVLEQREPST